jgi:hypothetical protein
MMGLIPGVASSLKEGSCREHMTNLSLPKG